MNSRPLLLALAVTFGAPAVAHDLSLSAGHLHSDPGTNAPAFFTGNRVRVGNRFVRTNQTPPAQRTALSAFAAKMLLQPLFFTSVFSPPQGNGSLMSASFAPFQPKVRTYWDGSTFYVEGDNTPSGMPNKMAGITAWQQQIPLPVAYFANTTNPENSTGSLGYGQPNYWRIPLVPMVAGSPTLIFTPGSTNNNFQRGAIALASNGVAIFNPANNTGRVSYEIGELDYYGGHCGLADDYHYHIIPTHLYSRFGGPLSDDKPAAWALDGYPIYGFVEPDGTARQALDSNGGHDIGNGWGYHYHAVGNNTVDATHPYGTPQSPYTMTSFKGTVVNFGGQVDGQPEVGSIRQDGTGGYNAKAISGAYIVAMMNPAPLVTDGSGNLSLPTGVNLTGCATTFGTTTVNCTSTTGLAQGMAIVGLGVSNGATVTQINGNGTQFTMSAPAIATNTNQNFTAVSLTGASADQYVMRVNMSGVDYDECWKINRSVNPRTLTVTWRAQALISGQLSGPVVTTTNTYTPNAGTASGNRLAAYTMSGASQTAIPDTSQVLDTTATFGEDSDYTIHPQSFTDNGNGTITDNVTGLMWQKTDNGESTWENAVANAAGLTTGGFTDWRLPTPSELFGIFNHNNGNPAALNSTYFPNNPNGTAEYWWTSDVYGTSTTNVWCSNAGGGLGPKPKSETISAGGSFRYHARYVRGAKPTNSHNYQNNGDGTITDNDSGLMWTQVPGPATTWDAALTYAESLTLGGFNDWRLPNIKELQTLTDYTLATATSAANIKPSVNRTMFAKTLTNCTTTAGGTTINCSDTTGLIPGMVLVDTADIAGTYIPTATPPVVATVGTGTFTVVSGTGIVAGSGITLKALVKPTAYWSSTTVKGGTTTEAWLVETGINTTSNPQRNSQGIISYEAKTASYPVFAVRTTSVATQIAVAQGANTLTDGVSTVGYSAPGAKTFTITNTGVTSLTLNGVTVDGANAANFTLGGAPANPTTLAPNATVTFTVTFSATSAASYSAALHIASSDTAVGAAFDVNLTGTIPVISNVAISPSTPVTGDTPFITAKITPTAGTTISQVQLTYNVGSQTTATAFRETFSTTPTTSGGWTTATGGAQNAWTVTANRNAADVKQKSSTSNSTVPIVLTNCTTNGTTTVTTTSSTANLWPGMTLSGTNIAAGTTITSVGSSSFVINPAATGSGSPLTLTAAGVTLTSCSLGTSPTVNTASTTSLNVGMGISGSGLSTNPPNPTVASIGGATSFNLSSTTVTSVGTTLTASGSGTEFSTGNSTYTDTMIATTNPIDASGKVFTSGSSTTNYVEFYVRTSDLVSNNGWQFQVSPDGTAGNFTTRLSETYTGSSAANCTLNSGNDQTNGSTTVLCSNTANLSVGNGVQGAAISVASCTTSTTTNPTVVLTANTGSLAVGMFVSGTGAAGIPNTARIVSINPGVSFTMNVSATASGTSTLLANYFPSNATISSITANTSFVVSSAVFYSGSGITVSTVNHGFKKFHYDLQSGDLTANMKMRFQFSGYNAVSPAKVPVCDIDDIAVVLTSGVPAVTITMYDDGLHGDGAAGDGIYGAQLPSFSIGSLVTYSISVTDSSSTVSTLVNAGSYTVATPLSITTGATLPGALTSAAYTQSLVATGGSGILADPQCVFDFEDNHGVLVAKLRADDDSPGDLALKILRKAPDDAWRAFDKKAVKVRRAMTSYRATKPLHAPSRERLTKLEALMAPWFDDNKRSEVCRVRALREDGGWAFVIRHGDPLSRIPIIAERGESSSALLRPERLDIAFFNEKTGEWLISGVGRELQELYRRSLGKVLHGSTDALARSSRYTLDPLRRGPDWLTSAQIESVQAAVLKELVFERTSGARVSLAQCDVFAELNNLGPAYVESCQFVEAKLALKLRHRRALVPIVINPSRDSIAGAAGLPAVDAWLANRQFAITHEDITILASH